MIEHEKQLDFLRKVDCLQFFLQGLVSDSLKRVNISVFTFLITNQPHIFALNVESRTFLLWDFEADWTQRIVSV
jgi:hypothetical protein